MPLLNVYPHYLHLPRAPLPAACKTMRHARRRSPLRQHYAIVSPAVLLVAFRRWRCTLVPLCRSERPHRAGACGTLVFVELFGA